MQTLLLSRLSAFVRLGRPVFLVGGFVFYGLGAAIASFRGCAIDWPRFAWGQFAVTAIQLMTHYANDYFDLEADRANTTPTRWSGGSRVLPNGELPPKVALVAAIVLAAMAVLAVVTLHTALSATTAASLSLLAALALAWAYSAPPLRLHSRGLGELDTALILTALVPFAGYALQAPDLEPVVVAAIAPLFLLQFAMLLAVEFPDEAGDAVVGKRTLVVRMGARRAGWLYVFVLALPYVLLPVWVRAGLPESVALALLLALPLAAFLVALVLRGAHRDPERWNRIAFSTTALVVSSALLELGAFLSITLRRP